MPLMQQLTERAERERLELEATLPPAGRRSGEGANSVVPHLARSRDSGAAGQNEAAERKDPEDRSS